MPFRARLAGLALVPLLAGAASGPERLAYPSAPRSDAVDDYHGTAVPDPYRTLEDPDAPETRAFVEAENRLTRRFLSEIPERGAILSRLVALGSIGYQTPPLRRGKKLFFERNDGRQRRAALWVVDAPGAAPRLLLDPNVRGADGGTPTGAYEFARDGTRIAYALGASGAARVVWKVRLVDSGRELEDAPETAPLSSAAFSRNGTELFHVRVSGTASVLVRHELGTPAAKDRVLIEAAGGAGAELHPQVTADGRWLVVREAWGSGRGSRLWAGDLRKKSGPLRRLLEGPDAAERFAGNDGSTFYLLTDRGAPRGRIVAVDAAAPFGTARAVPREIVAEGAGVLRDATLAGGRIVLKVLQDGSDVLRIHRLDGTFEKEIPLPDLGSVGDLDAAREDRELYFAFTSFTWPATALRYDFDRTSTEIVHRPQAPFDPAAFETRRVFVTSRDGTRVPLFFVTKAGTPPTGAAPTWLTGYGGFGVALTPSFSPERIVWLEMGGLFAQACVRGGGEYGEAWHRAGMRGNKENGLDDFAAAAAWLGRSGYTRSARIALAGASNGGLLVAATLVRHPELAGAAVVSSGVLDLLRFPRLGAGSAWVPEYGDPGDPEQFGWLMASSPLHNVKTGERYPATLVVTSEHDERVAPAHSLKLAAALQAAQGGEAPVLLRVEPQAANVAERPLARQLEETADVYAFLLRTIRGLTPPGYGPLRW